MVESSMHYHCASNGLYCYLWTCVINPFADLSLQKDGYLSPGGQSLTRTITYQPQYESALANESTYFEVDPHGLGLDQVKVTLHGKCVLKSDLLLRLHAFVSWPASEGVHVPRRCPANCQEWCRYPAGALTGVRRGAQIDSLSLWLSVSQHASLGDFPLAPMCPMEKVILSVSLLYLTLRS